MKILKILFSGILTGVILLFGIKPALAFCGFYVAKADSSLYNQASQVIIARDGNKTVLTMSNDYQGEVKDFAMVVPVPVVLTQEQVHIADPKIIDRLDAFSAPRLVEYFDENPCIAPPPPCPTCSTLADSGAFQKIAGVTVEQQFTVGEYDIIILSAKESDGLETWLTDNGYQLPQNAKELLQPYIRQDLKFFVAKVNLEEFENKPSQKLRPLSIAYESPKFMLPIRLGMSNAKVEQDLIVYLLSPDGQTQLTNYRTITIPSDFNIPQFVENKFGDFYQAMFQTTYEKENKQAAILEYAWNMTWCDPCSADPLSQEELKQAGVHWLDDPSRNNSTFITRLHLRYSREKFPEDLFFQSTNNKANFQGRYIIRHPFPGITDIKSCPPLADDSDKYAINHRLQMTQWLKREGIRKEKEIQNLADVTGWDIKEIRAEIGNPIPWWHNLWN